MPDLPHLIDSKAGWMRDAGCRGVNTDIFFPPSMSHPDATTAVLTCSRCPVQNECARYAIVNEIEFGIYGGLSPRARREIASSKTKSDSSKEQRTYDLYMEMKRQNRPDPVKATAKELSLSTATVYHHVRVIRFRIISETLN